MKKYTLQEAVEIGELLGICDVVFRLQYKTWCLNGEVVNRTWRAKFYGHPWSEAETQDKAVEIAINEFVSNLTETQWKYISARIDKLRSIKA